MYIHNSPEVSVSLKFIVVTLAIARTTYAINPSQFIAKKWLTGAIYFRIKTSLTPAIAINLMRYQNLCPKQNGSCQTCIRSWILIQI